MRLMMMAAGVVLLAACSRSDAPADSSVPAVENAGSNEAYSAEANTGSAIEETNTPSEADPCHVQGSKEIPASRLKAIGTEPFWAATIDGRCVTYSTPENQRGTRIWATFTGSLDNGQWTGFLGKERFVLVTRPHSDCSDGMSDRTYPIAVTLKVGTDERRGCASPE